MCRSLAMATLLTVCAGGCLPPPEAEDAKPSPEAPRVDETAESESKVAETQTDDNASDAATAGGVTVEAEAGVGRRGRGYGGGMVTEPIKQYFRAQELIQFHLMEQSIRDFKTLNGRMPKTHEEFMKEIVEARAIKLPELPDGEEYVYDPDREELMVRRPQ